MRHLFLLIIKYLEKMKNRLPILVLLWFFIVITFAAFVTSCSTYQVVLESNEDPLVTQNMQNIMELIRTCEEMKEHFGS